MKKIYLVRHGQSTTNAGGEMRPNALIELTDLGHKQASAAAEWLSTTLGNEITSISVSGFLRTQQTAQPLLDKVGSNATLIDGLEEFDFLSLAKTIDVPFKRRLEIVDEFWAVTHPDDLHGEDSESYSNFYARVAQVLTYFKALPDGNHVVYTHGLWISMLIWQILGQPSKGDINMRKFRQFEQSIRAQNCEIFCLTLPPADLSQDYPPAVTKVRTCSNPSSDLSA